jgi:hypothetical protein
MTQRGGMTARELAVCMGLAVIGAFPITSRSSGGGVEGLLENVAGLLIVLLLLIGLEKLLSNRTHPPGFRCCGIADLDTDAVALKVQT